MTTLINCKVCQKEMSNQAEVCPNCNHPYQKEREQKSNQNGMYASLLLLIVIAVIIALEKEGKIDLSGFIKDIFEKSGIKLPGSHS